MLPEASYHFRERNIVTPEAKALFRTLEFKSLIPEDDVPLKDFASLNITPVFVEHQAQLDDLTQVLLKGAPCSIAPISSDNQLTGMAIGIGEQWYVLDFSKYSGKIFLETLLNSSLEIVGFDLKETLKLLKGYTKNSSQLREEQIGLIF